MIEDNYIKLIINLKAERDALILKYGKGNRIVKKLTNQIQVMADYYDAQDNQRKLNKLLKTNFIASQMIRTKKVSSYEDQAKLHGFDVEKWKQMDKIDQEIEEIKKMME